MEANTASLRGAAPQWSLAGDKQLLDILQNIHQSLVTRCQEVNRKLDEMVVALDGASVDLQNVNNKFMALSNSQFIESRVYDDDVDVAVVEQPKETPKPSEVPSQGLDRLKHSIRVLESSHEIIEILDSDSEESDDDEVTRTVLMPKDMYGHRPLPYIIGSQPWRNKWHAGLHPEDSDSDSSGSKPDPQRDQYSDSEPEQDFAPQTHTHHDIGVSTGSSELPSEQHSNVGSLSTAGPKSPSDVAAELARRLGGNPDKLPPVQTQYSPPSMATKKVYRPDQPSAGTVFCDEPPPLDQYQSEEDLPSEDDDIFAELHKGKTGPYPASNKEQSRLAEDLFSGLGKDDEGDIFSDFRDDKVTSTPAPKKSSLFEDESEPELFANKPAHAPPSRQEPAREEIRRQDAEPVKKPIGGISLFGNTKGAESIGAAILKRNQRRSSSDESDAAPQTKEPTPPKSKEKDIFDDLFAKSEREQKNKAKKNDDTVPKVPKDTKAKVDLFSDNIFDDIDDIFTSNISTVSKKEKKEEKPLFDDDDDLFSGIAVSTEKADVKSTSKSSKKKSIFDSDDDLFTDKPEIVETKTKPVTNDKKQFEDVDDIFSDIIESKERNDKSNIVNVVAEEITRNVVKNDNNVVDNVPRSQNNGTAINKKPVTDKTPKLSEGNSFENRGANNNIEESTKSIFGDEDDDELFATGAKKPSDENSNIVDEKSSVVKSVVNPKGNQKSSLFDDDSDENDLFGSSKKPAVTKENNVNFKESVDNSNNAVNKNVISVSSGNNAGKLQNTSLFDDDLEDDDIFASSQTSNLKNSSKSTNQTHKDAKTENITHAIDKPVASNKSIFDDDNDFDDTDMFGDVNKLASESKSIIKDEAPIVEKQKPSENEQKPSILSKPTIKSEKPLLDKPSLGANDENNTSNKPKPKVEGTTETNIQTVLSEDQKSFNKDPKPTINEETSTLQKPQISRDKPSIVKRKAETEPTKLTKDEINDNLYSKVDIEPKTVDSKVSISKDNKSIEEIPTNTVADELFRPKQESNTKLDFKDKPVEYKIPDLDQIEGNDNSLDEEALFSEPKDTLYNTPAVFDDIFSEPPAFEKSSEPKKSKNVNALFDDDSDDEALFFKKNDATLDEQPDVSGENSRDALFGIFHEEPPALEIDFTQKASKANLNDDFLKSDSDDDLFTIKTKKPSAGTSQNIQKQTAEEVTSKSTKIAENVSKSQSEVANITTKTSPVSHKAEMFEQKSKIESKDSTDSETKKVGKLKSMNFNIDVSTLLPGASPKRKTFEQTDGQVVSTRSNESIQIEKDALKKSLQPDLILSAKSHEDLHAKDEVEPSVLKSVSFDGEPDSNILDNKLSKSRAKIQVKRRPSTRRARKEAVRKSAIDLDDSTDNSSSFDDPPRPSKSKSETRLKDEAKNDSIKPVEVDDSASVKSEIESNEITKTNTVPEVRNDTVSTNPEIDKNNSDIDPKIPAKGTTKHIDTTDSKQIDEVKYNVTSNTNKPTNSQNIETEFKRPENKNVTSKIVYILNDEDIFSNPVETPQKSKVLNIVDDDNDDNLFRNLSKNDNVSGISTLGNAYKEIASHIEREVKSAIENQAKIDSSNGNTSNVDNQKVIDKSKASNKIDTDNTDTKKANKTKKSLFDDLSEDENELFNPNKKPIPKAKGILDSDSEDDLFGGRKKEMKDNQPASARETKEKVKVEVKGSLFGDEDDDDLFAVKVKSNVAAVNPQPTKASREPATKPAEPVFDDPLSLLGGADD